MAPINTDLKWASFVDLEACFFIFFFGKGSKPVVFPRPRRHPLRPPGVAPPNKLFRGRPSVCRRSPASSSCSSAGCQRRRYPSPEPSAKPAGGELTRPPRFPSSSRLPHLTSPLEVI